MKRRTMRMLVIAFAGIGFVSIVAFGIMSHCIPSTSARHIDDVEYSIRELRHQWAIASTERKRALVDTILAVGAQQSLEPHWRSIFERAWSDGILTDQQISAYAQFGVDVAITHTPSGSPDTTILVGAIVDTEMVQYGYPAQSRLCVRLSSATLSINDCIVSLVSVRPEGDVWESNSHLQFETNQAVSISLLMTGTISDCVTGQVIARWDNTQLRTQLQTHGAGWSVICRAVAR